MNNNVYKHYKWAYEIYRNLLPELYGLSVQELFPTAVMCAVFDDTYLRNDIGILIPVLIWCIQELGEQLCKVESQYLPFFVYNNITQLRLIKTSKSKCIYLCKKQQ